MPCNAQDLEQCMQFQADHFMNELQVGFASDPDIVQEYSSLIDSYMQSKMAELRNENAHEAQ